MGYTITIGNAKPVHYRDGESLLARWAVEIVCHDMAPAVPNQPSDRMNLRMPSYQAWAEFCRETNIDGFFYDDNGDVRGGYPGTRILTQTDLALVRQARAAWEQQPSKRPGFYSQESCGGVVVRLHPESDRDDANLARLKWLEYWIDWAIHHCETPAMDIN